MRNTLKLLYDKFYTPVPMAEAEHEIEVCHRQLIERLEKPERKLVLRIMDTQNLMAEERSMDSFLCGFHLALEMANELNCYKQDRQSLPAEEDETDAGSDDYNRKQYHKTIITEPKRRELSIPQLRDKIVQLTIHEELQNLFRPVFLNRSFACQYGRGPVRAAYNVQHDLRTAYRKWGDAAVIIKIDVKKFFYSIDRTILKRIIAKRFGAIKKKRPERYDDLLRFYKLLVAVIDSSPEGERGIPLGNVSSQDMANIYLNELDQYCVRYLGIKLYTRYMDDIVIVAPDKETAREWLAKIKAYLAERLHLETNQKTKIFYTRQGVNAYGFKIKGTHLLLRTETKRAVKRRTKKMMEKMRAGEITRKEVEQAAYSWLGFARWANAYTLCKKVFAPYRFIKVEGEMLYGAISRPCKTRRLLQKRRSLAKTHKTVET